jgi:hypothetical protein
MKTAAWSLQRNQQLGGVFSKESPRRLNLKNNGAHADAYRSKEISNFRNLLFGAPLNGGLLEWKNVERRTARQLILYSFSQADINAPTHRRNKGEDHVILSPWPAAG